MSSALPAPSSRVRAILGGGSDGWEILTSARRMERACERVINLTTGEHEDPRFRRRWHLVLASIEGAQALRVSPPEGAMYVMLNVRAAGSSGLAFARELLESERIAVMPGESFGTAAAGHVRVALTVPEAALEAALARIAALAARRAAGRAA